MLPQKTWVTQEKFIEETPILFGPRYIQKQLGILNHFLFSRTIYILLSSIVRNK
ncbi:hypothetical protein ES705_40213 [subsurface metagenome]